MKLAEIYDELNQHFFLPKLPKFRVEYSDNFSDGFLPGQLGECDERRRLIRVSPSLKGQPGDLRRTLLHEMCHIGTPGHGKKFRFKLQRLADQGEEWAIPEAAGLAEQPWPLIEARVKQGLYDTALDLGQGAPRHLDSSIAHHLGWSLKALRRSMPWVDLT